MGPASQPGLDFLSSFYAHIHPHKHKSASHGATMRTASPQFAAAFGKWGTTSDKKEDGKINLATDCGGIYE